MLVNAVMIVLNSIYPNSVEIIEVIPPTSIVNEEPPVTDI